MKNLKRMVCIFFTIFVLLGETAYAGTLKDVLLTVMERQGVEITDDETYVNKLQNRNNIVYKNIVSTAIKNGLLVAKNRLVDLDGNDFTPLTDAVSKKCLKDDDLRFVCGTIPELEKTEHPVFFGETFYVTENMSKDDLNQTDLYTCVVNAKNEVLYVWKAGEIKRPCLYRATLYWAEEGKLIVKNLERKAFRFWIAEESGYSEIPVKNNICVDENFILYNLDSTVYFLADSYGGIEIYGIGK